MPANFSVAYAFAFCAGVYFRGARAWWLTLGIMLATDLGLNLYYSRHGVSVWDLPDLENLIFNYAAYAALIFLGRRFKPQSSFLGLLGGGLLGAILAVPLTATLKVLLKRYIWNKSFDKTAARPAPGREQISP